MPTDAAFATLVTLVLGVITSVVASVTLIVTKENRISEFRQAWIDGQRSDSAVAIATANAYFHIRDIERKAACLSEFFGARTRIALRDKPVGGEWTKTLIALDKLGKILTAGVPNAFEILQATTIVTYESRMPLKKHWETVKSGEPFYRRFKRAVVCALAVLAAGTLCLLVLSTRLTKKADEREPSISLMLNVQ